MINKITLKNFKSFKYLEFKIEDGKNTNPLFFIYGENGSGKSNIIASIKTLVDLTASLYDITNFNKILQDEFENKDSYVELIRSFQKPFQVDYILENTKTRGSKDSMKLDYEFVINNNEYHYTIEFNNEKIIGETLRAPLSKNRVNVFDISYNDNLDINFNPNLFEKEYEKEIKSNIKKYFGNYSFLSIINFEEKTKNKDFINENIHRVLLSFIKYINNLSVLYKEGRGDDHNYLMNESLLYNLESGIIDKTHIKRIDKTSEVLSYYFKSLYSDIKDVYYKTVPKGKEVTYQLFFKKMIGGEITDIPFYLESRGTKQLLDLFPYIIRLLFGGIVAIDEIDSGIHDLLIKILIEKLNYMEIKGQLIATTHNTMMLDMLDKNQIYILDIDDAGNKVIYNLKSSGIKIQANHSVYNHYKKGSIGGVPIVGYFDFQDLVDCLVEEE